MIVKPHAYFRRRLRITNFFFKGSGTTYPKNALFIPLSSLIMVTFSVPQLSLPSHRTISGLNWLERSNPGFRSWLLSVPDNASWTVFSPVIHHTWFGYLRDSYVSTYSVKDFLGSDAHKRSTLLLLPPSYPSHPYLLNLTFSSGFLTYISSLNPTSIHDGSFRLWTGSWRIM